MVSYLDYLHSHYGPTVAGFSDFALGIGGGKACTGDQNSAPGMPVVSAAVFDAAHRELCP
jgi:hypothetical protein